MDNPTKERPKMSEMIVVPEVQPTDVVTPQAPDIDTNPMSFQTEINKIAAEMGGEIKDGQFTPKTAVVVPTRTPEAVSQPDKADQPTADAQPKVDVPQKFQTPDGQVDVAKVEKSTLAAQEALNKYREMEKELRAAQNSVRDLKSPQTVPAPGTPGMPTLDQITPEMIEQAIRQQGLGRTQLELAAIAQNTAYARARADFEAKFGGLEERVESDQRIKELESIAENDPWVLSAEGIDTLKRIRSSNPHINMAPRPWTEAYDKYLAMEAKKKRQSQQVLTPTPKAPTAKAPATPVSAARVAQVKGPNAGDPKALNAHLDKLNAKEQEAFWDRVLPGRRK